MLIKSGDYFCVSAPDDAEFLSKFLAHGIRLFTAMGSKDDEAKYSHAGIILDEEGNTFEALTTYKVGNLNNYVGSPIIIGRHFDMTDEIANASSEKIMVKFAGKMYPFIRLGLFLIPLAAKFLHFAKPVCSELCFLHMKHSNLRRNIHGDEIIDFYWSITPDYMADFMKNSNVFNIVYEGIWE